MPASNHTREIHQTGPEKRGGWETKGGIEAAPVDLPFRSPNCCASESCLSAGGSSNPPDPELDCVHHADSQPIPTSSAAPIAIGSRGDATFVLPTIPAHVTPAVMLPPPTLAMAATSGSHRRGAA